MAKVFIVIVLSFIFIYCSDSTNSNENYFGLPTEFPLAEGNAWVYAKQYFQFSEDSSIIDTLFIFGKYLDYFKYSWNPTEQFFLIKNYNDMLICYGDVLLNVEPDTLMYDSPIIWSFFNEDTGFINSENYVGYKVPFANMRIDKISNIEIFNTSYDGYITSVIDTITNVAYRQEIIIKEGIYKRLYFNRITGAKIRETTLIQKLQNFYP